VIIRREAIQITSDTTPSEQIKGCTGELQGRRSGGDLGVEMTLCMIRKGQLWHQARNDVEKGCRQCDIYTDNCGPRNKARRLLHRYNIGAPFSRIIIDEVGPFPQNDQRNRYFVMVVDYFTKWQKAHAVPNQEASKVAEALVTCFFCSFGVP
jgi:hypothetical protein